MNKINLQKLKTIVFDKRSRYLLVSGALTGLLYFVNSLSLLEDALFAIVAFLLVVALGGLIYGLYYNKDRRPLVFSGLLPLHLIIGYLLVFYYFPNLGPLVKVLAYFSFASILYATFLVNNIFLVVIEQGELIPLYNVAITWVQIIIIVISIPYVSGIYKIPLNFLSQNIIIVASAIMFNFYLIWATYLDPDIRATRVEERTYLTLMLAFLLFAFGIATSFFSTESFLKALFISTILMFNLGYTYAHYKNRINSRLVFEYSIISLIFFIILFVATP